MHSSVYYSLNKYLVCKHLLSGARTGVFRSGWGQLKCVFPVKRKNDKTFAVDNKVPGVPEGHSYIVALGHAQGPQNTGNPEMKRIM